MTPGARIQATIEILDAIADGAPAEKALIGWARRSRFAGSGDRAAVRDHVFQALRCWRSFAALGGADTGRGRMIGALRAEGVDPEDLFTGAGHAPSPLSDAEKAVGADPSGDDARDMPAWLMEKLRMSLGDRADSAAEALRHRAPVMLRVNCRKCDAAGALRAMQEDDIKAASHPIAKNALLVTEGARRIARSRAYLDGLVELQDGSSQAAMESVGLTGVARILDYCAGGGGKSLALAARSSADIFAHDSDARRMQDLPQRALRAGANVTLLKTSSLPDNALFDLVLCDVPCSGSGTWRRTPEAKWRLTPDRLQALLQAQSDILDQAAPLVRAGGQLIYATCSLLSDENERQVDSFIARTPGWVRRKSHRWDVTDGGDGFFVAHLSRDQ